MGVLNISMILKEVTIAVSGKCAKESHMWMVSERKGAKKWVLYRDRASKGHTWTLNLDLTQNPSISEITKGNGEQLNKEYLDSLEPKSKGQVVQVSLKCSVAFAQVEDEGNQHSTSPHSSYARE